MAEIQHFSMIIGGENVDTGETFAVHNPATGQQIATVAQASREEVDRAVEAARAAFHGAWKKTTPAKRTRLLMKVAEIMRERMRELVALEVLNTGKAVSGVIGEVHQAIEDFEFYAGATTKIYGQTYPAAPFVFNYTLKEPVGVCAQIIPWNYPLMMAAWKIAPALAAGCTVVLKPASLTPLTAVKLVEICHEAGIPAGVVNIVTGPGATVGAYLAEHPGVDKIAFTGETETGKSILAGAAKTIKKATMELGGKSPNLVFPDANLDDAVNGSIWAVFTSTGQTCEARSRLFVHEDVYDEFVTKFVERTKSLRIGDPADKTAHVGSLISRKQWETVDAYVKIGLEEGAELLCGGGRPEGLEERFAEGHFYLPTVLANVHNKMRVAQEEIFGPVVVIIKFSSERDVIEQANDTIYGLAATLWTKDTARAHRVASQLQTGIVTVNHPYTAFPGTPFGGSKQTGFGRELAFETLNLYSETKSVLVYTSDKPVNPFGL